MNKDQLKEKKYTNGKLIKNKYEAINKITCFDF